MECRFVSTIVVGSGLRGGGDRYWGDLPRDLVGGSVQAGTADSRSDVNLVLKSVGATVGVDAAALCIVKLAAEGKDGAVEVANLGLEENKLLRLEHGRYTVSLAARLDLWIEGFRDLLENISAFGRRLACEFLAWKWCFDACSTNPRGGLVAGSRADSTAVLRGVESVRHLIIRVVAIAVLEIHNLPILEVPARDLRLELVVDRMRTTDLWWALRISSWLPRLYQLQAGCERLCRTSPMEIKPTCLYFNSNDRSVLAG
jgi:hypothetical protein